MFSCGMGGSVRHCANAVDHPSGTRTNHLTVVSLPKSATVYFQRSMEATLSVVHRRITCPSGNIRDDIIAKDLFAYVAQPRAMAGDHVPASGRNLHLLAA